MTIKELRAALLLLRWSKAFYGANTESWKKSHHIIQHTLETDMTEESWVVFINWYDMDGEDLPRSRLVCSDINGAYIEAEKIS